jgi:metallophosphoesterase (TIGR00282 family)
LTSGNHIWDKKDSLDFINREGKLLRPANYPEGTPGQGSAIYTTAGGTKVAVLNLEGRVFMNNLDCPFRTADRELDRLRTETAIILVDFHAEATSEKTSLGWYLDGRVSALIGTHTHIQTADERLLPGGTAYITDAGMTGSFDSVIGVKKEEAITKFLSQLPVKFEVAKNNLRLNGVTVTVDEQSGKALSIERINIGCELI